MTFLTTGRLVGRDDELAGLEDALGEASSGAARVVLLVGEAGIGKTRLLRELAERARARDATVLVGSATTYAYGPLVGILRDLRRDVGDPRLRKLLIQTRRPLIRLVPGLEPGGGTGDGQVASQAPLFEAVLDLLSKLGEDRPLLVAMEDLHDADESSRELVSFLADNLTTERLLLVVTCRTGEGYRQRIGGFLSELVRHPHVGRIDLSSLSERQVSELLAAIGGEPPDEEVAVRIARRSQGNPFYVEELLAAGIDDRGLPTGLEELLTARLAELSDAARQVLGAASVLGSRPHDRLLRAIIDLPQEQLRTGLQEVADQRLLTPEDVRSDRYRFRHDLIREVAHRRLLIDRRRRLHAEAARHLQAEPQLADGGPDQLNAELARHWHLAGEPDEAFAASSAAADEARDAHALSEALAHLQRALELWDDISEDTRAEVGPRDELEQRCADLAVLLADPRAGLEHVRRALETPGVQAARRAMLQARAAYFLRELGRPDEEHVAIDRALAIVPAVPSPERAETLARAAGHRFFAGRSREALQLSEDAIAAAVEADDRRVESMARNYHGGSLVALGREDEGLDELEESLRIAAEVSDPEEIKRARINLSVNLMRAGRYEDGAKTADEALAWARERGVGASKQEWIILNGVDALVHAGRWDDAERQLRTVRSVRRATVITDVEEARLTAFLRMHQGRTDEARQLLDRIEPVAEDLPPDLEGPYLAQRAELATVEGRHDDVRAIARSAAEEGGRSLLEQGLATYETCVLLDPTLALAIRAEADRAIDGRGRQNDAAVAQTREQAEEWLGILRDATDAAVDGTHVQALLRAAATQGEAELTRLDGDSDPDAWQTAVEAAAATGIPHREAYARFRHAEALLSAGERDAAARTLEEADRIAGALGAASLGQEIASLARRGRLGLEIAHRDADLGADLTPREADVLELLAEGRTNREIAGDLYVSEKTVERYVTGILRKLQADNRTEAAAVARKRDLLDR